MAWASVAGEYEFLAEFMAQFQEAPSSSSKIKNANYIPLKDRRKDP